MAKNRCIFGAAMLVAGIALMIYCGPMGAAAMMALYGAIASTGFSMVLGGMAAGSCRAVFARHRHCGEAAREPLERGLRPLARRRCHRLHQHFLVGRTRGST